MTMFFSPRGSSQHGEMTRPGHVGSAENLTVQKQSHEAHDMS
jgi:hypothetical protein